MKPVQVGALCAGIAITLLGGLLLLFEEGSLGFSGGWLAATVTAVEVVVVGEQVPTTRPVTWTLEDPRGGGPAAGLLTALGCFYRPPDLVQVLAVDMPQVTPGTFARLVEAVEEPADGAAYDGPTGWTHFSHQS